MRLIDADALMKTLGITDLDCRKCAWYEQAWNRCRRGATFSDACCAIEHAPTIEERKTGEWIEAEVMPKTFDVNGIETWASKMQCDQCGFITYAIEGHMGQYNFCPSCGADMRGDKHEVD